MNAAATNLQYKTDNKLIKTNANIIKFPKNKNKGGRPSPYTEELAEEICIAIMDSDKGIARLCKEHKHWPSKKTIFNWLKKNEEFKRKYEVAKAFQVEELMDELLVIPNGFLRHIYDENGNKRISRDDIELLRIRIDIFKWKIAGLIPRKHRYLYE